MTTLEVPDHADHAVLVHALLAQFGRIDALAPYTGEGQPLWQIGAGSALAGDDARTDPYRLSHSAVLALVVAIDHLRALTALVRREVKDGEQQMLLHSHAPFTLLRAALENAARAVWLLGPSRRLDRVSRCLRMHHADIANVTAKATLLDFEPDKAEVEERKNRIKALLRAAGVQEADLTNGNLRMPGYGKIVADAGNRTGTANAELWWSLCSSLAHGDQSGTLAVLKRRITATDGDVHSLRISAPLGAVVAAVKNTVGMAESAVALYSDRARSPHPA
ncbi:hypothetical protein ACFVUY_42470 [Kitasatospora sp. NPDC058063]|uniref:hypothetical protein n=1 Tax=unclassified Kitasatospora TaxID=2633591 RepID=UPI0036DC642C